MRMTVINYFYLLLTSPLALFTNVTQFILVQMRLKINLNNEYKFNNNK